MRQYDRKAPAFVDEMLAKFGQNPCGENLYKVVWAEGETELSGGIWHDHMDPNKPAGALIYKNGLVMDENPLVGQKAEYRRVQKYPDTQRWLLVKWLPPSYSREQYRERFTDVDSGMNYLGPYQEQGTYELCYKLERKGGFMPLTLAIVEYYCRLIEAGKDYSSAQKRIAQEVRIEKQKRAWETHFDDVFDEAQDAGGTGNLFSAVSGRKSKDRVKPEDVSFGDTRNLPAWVPKEAGFRQI